MNKTTKRDDKIYKSSNWHKLCKDEENRHFRLKNYELEQQFKGKPKNETMEKLKNIYKFI